MNKKLDQNKTRKYRGFQILKIEGINEIVWSVRDVNGEAGIRFRTLRGAKQFIDAQTNGGPANQCFWSDELGRFVTIPGGE
jgi:hypothetical protein